MRQPFPIVFFGLLLVIGCGRKSVPQKTNNVKVHSGPVVKPPEHTKDNAEPALIKKSKVEKEEITEPKVEKKEELLPMIVIDGMGNVITPKEKLPEAIAAKADYRGFEPSIHTQSKNQSYLSI
jgi:hypothetical protein